jgi:hypothetical protein
MKNTTDVVTTPQPVKAGKPENKPAAPAWMFKVMNPMMTALLRSPLHGALSGMLMLLSYEGRKTGKRYTHPVGYFQWDGEAVVAYTSARWWTNLTDGRTVTLRIKGRTYQATPTVIRQREEMIQTVAELFTRLGPRKAGMLPLGLPKDRQPTEEELHSIPSGGTFVRFKLIGQNSK